MILIFILLCIAAAYSYAFYYTGLSLWFYFLWVPLSIAFAFLTFFLFVLLAFQYMKRTDPKKKFRHRLMYQVCQMILFLLNIRVKVIGKEQIPRETFVCYANHKSDLDPIILYASFHRVCSAVGKKSLFQNPIIRQCQPVFGAISLDRDNDREAAKAMIEAIRAVRNGLSYIIFPEGGIKTRETEEMVNLRAGAYKLVTKSEALLLPVTILGSSKIKKRKNLFKSLTVQIIVHKPLSKEEYESQTTTELGEYVMNMINKDVLAHEK